MSTTLQLNEEQAEALRQVRRWREDDPRREFRLGGLAGTGKTTVAAEIAGFVRTLYTAYTAKAVSVLRSKGARDAQTLHSLLYYCEGEDEDEQPIFSDREEVEHAPLVIVDEASMVTDQIRRDLQDNFAKILYVGDHGQLEPVGDDGSIMDEPDVALERIMRQGEGSKIIEFSRLARKYGNSPAFSITGCRDFNGQDEVVRISKRTAASTFLETEGDKVLICGRNKTRVNINKHVRDVLGYAGRNGGLPVVGDRMICLRNNKDVGVFNGLLATVTADAVRVDGETYHVSIHTDDGRDISVLGFYEQLNREGGAGMSYDYTFWDFGYALTCHKAQGSEWDTVVVVDEPVGKKPDSKQRWRYTAITRASKKLYWCGL